MERRVAFASGAVTLEGLLHVPSGGCEAGAVVCHPHPLYGGEMMNNVVQALVEELSERGLATLRFNFRGTGASGGSHGGGEAEKQDVRAAVGFLGHEADVTRIVVAGYSFGAHVGMDAAAGDDRVVALVGVSLPVGMMDASVLEGCTKPKLLVAGGRDDIGPVVVLGDLLARIPEPKSLEVVEGADHFWSGLESEAARIAGAWVERVTRGRRGAPRSRSSGGPSPRG
jgi:alpha/beta superfamily hydrolase